MTGLYQGCPVFNNGRRVGAVVEVTPVVVNGEHVADSVQIEIEAGAFALVQGEPRILSPTFTIIGEKP